MEFRPRHPQPFSLEVAEQLSVPEITGEIARLQNSLKHLQSTQTELEPYISGSERDQDLVNAYEENRQTIASQEERITMLRFALERKGASFAANPHYQLSDATARQEPPASSAPTAPPTVSDQETDDANGLYL
ncbi:hypothetical protein FRB90_005223 [Tulasnella sp. 427]|nr:hypothetical protein FRB90_005223 [Tulasnella sp. 427]